MNTIALKNQVYSLATDESIVSCLLRHGIDYPHSCQAGVCQSCLMKVSNGVIDPSWQEGLPETLKAQGYFLACMARPITDLELLSPDTAECDVDAKIIDIKRLNYNILTLKLRVDHSADWIPGQYLSFINSVQVARSYSIANIPAQDGFIELHIKMVENGAMSQWLQQTARIDTKVTLRGPFGKCYYYNPENLSFDILLAGTGTGLAPLIGIIKSALNQKHAGAITLVHGGLIDDDIYYTKELETLADVFHNFHYAPCVLSSLGRYPEALIEQKVLTYLNKPENTWAYVCGPKDTTNKLKTNLFLAGVPSKAIFSDAFL